METGNWKNQYITLSDSLPTVLLSAQGRTLTPAEIAAIKAAVLPHPSCVVEFGSGSGGHILQQAEKNPHSLFIGFELRYKRAYRTAEKATQKNISNIFVVRADAEEVGNIFPPESLEGLYINFPDPWERHRWKKHRMISESSLKVWHSILKPGGYIRYKTDHEGYYDDTISLVDRLRLFTTTASTRNYYESQYSTESVESEFEKLFKYKALPIYFLELKK